MNVLFGLPGYARPSRIALVIGNGEYGQSRFPKLSNPVYDVQDVAALLQTLCFDVILRQNADQKTMRAAIEEFGRRLSVTGGIGLFYYSGHGVQYRQKNYLIPVDAAIQQEREIEAAAIDVNVVLDRLAAAGNAANILIFDACRAPFEAPELAALEKGFVAMQGPKGSVIVFATALGQTSYGDAAKRNSVYTRHFVQALRDRSRQDILEILREVNRRVAEESALYQVTPAVLNALLRDSLPAAMLQKLRHPLVFQREFTEAQFVRVLTEHVLNAPPQEQDVARILALTRQTQEPWLYTNIAQKIVLADACPTAPQGQLASSDSDRGAHRDLADKEASKTPEAKSGSPMRPWQWIVGAGIGGGAIVTMAALTADQDHSPDDQSSFTGTFQCSYVSRHTIPGLGEITIQNEEILTLREEGERITGNLRHLSTISECCNVETTVPVEGARTDEQTAILQYEGSGAWCTCRGTPVYISADGRRASYTLTNNGQTLQSETVSFARVN